MQEDDIIIDPGSDDLDDSVIAEEHQGDTIKKLREKLKVAESKAKEHLDNWQRAQADFVNLRKRDEEAKADFMKFANAGLIEDLIPVLDALNSAVSHGEHSVEPILNLFLKTLKQKGLEETNPLGQAFDPSLHEAIGMKETHNKEEDHKVLEVLQKGYALAGRVIRPAKVRVGEFKA